MPASKRLHCLQRGIIKQNKKAENIFLNALYIMLCCVKEVKIYEVFQSANQLLFFFNIFLYTLIRVEKKYLLGIKSQILNTTLIYPSISWFSFIGTWKLTWYWEVIDSSLKEIKFTRWYIQTSLLHSLVSLWIWASIANKTYPFLPCSKIKNDKLWKALSSSTKQHGLALKGNCYLLLKYILLFTKEYNNFCNIF